MTRAVRVAMAGGWNHVTARGLCRMSIYEDDKDRRHFLERIGESVERYGLVVRAYVLMDNHYHLLVGTPGANLSAGMQWLNVSYAAWYNRRHGRVGPVFQGRFKAIVVESEGQGGWGLELSRYIHLNPVRVKGLGLGKTERKVEGLVLRAPSAEQVRRRLEMLRGYRWSSYRAYAGYEAGEKWLSKGELLARSGRGAQRDRCRAYREGMERYLRQGQAEGWKAKVAAGMALGTEAFLERVRGLVDGNRPEQPELKEWDRRGVFVRAVKAVEAQKGERWEQFAQRRGDWGRDMVLWLARTRGGETLGQLGRQAGGMGYHAVGKAVSRMAQKISADRRMKHLSVDAARAMSHVETRP